MQKGFPMKPGVLSATSEEHSGDRPRPIEEILITYEMSPVRLPMSELDALWRFVMGGGVASAGYVDKLASLIDGTLEHPRASALFCQFWCLAKEREDYNKKHWTLLRQQLFLYGVML